MFHGNHQRYFVSQFKTVDKLLSEALANLRTADDGRLFVTHVADASAEQRQVLSDDVAQLRFLLRRFMQAQNFRDAQSPVSAVWSFRVAASFASTAVEELRPAYLRGYGEVDAESLRAAERLVADLKSLLRRMTNYLDHGEGGGTVSRLAELDATIDEIDLLRELDRVIAIQRLVELRSPLEQLVERATSPRFEVAVFGRVNSGKTSLLNWWLGRPLLPTGVTPVTAVPTRIVRGKTPQARVTLAGAPPFDIAPEQLVAYVTEDENPANSKRVLNIEIREPATRLVDGLCLVDTPGLGSLATGGTAQTLEYLPRCDLGVMLLEAGGLISREDVDVARAILDAGAELVVALSKADRLSAPELAEALKYAQAHLSAELHVSLEVRAISTRGVGVGLTEVWFQHELAPRVAAHHEQSARAFRRKTAVLREAVVALLQSRLRSNAKGMGKERAPSASPESDAASRAHVALERERRYASAFGLQIQAQIDPLVAAAAAAMTQGWTLSLKNPADLGTELQAAIARSANTATDELAERLKTLREQLHAILRELPIGSATAEELPPPRGRPVWEPGALSLPRNLRRPRGLGTLRSWMRAIAHQRLKRDTRASLERQLAIYADALRDWAIHYVDDLASEFEAAFAVRGGGERIDAERVLSDDGAHRLQDDLTRLQQWRR